MYYVYVAKTSDLIKIFMLSDPCRTHLVLSDVVSFQVFLVNLGRREEINKKDNLRVGKLPLEVNVNKSSQASSRDRHSTRWRFILIFPAKARDGINKP